MTFYVSQLSLCFQDVGTINHITNLEDSGKVIKTKGRNECCHILVLELKEPFYQNLILLRLAQISTISKRFQFFLFVQQV